MKVCHLTSVHPPNDIRIFMKECSSLAAAGFDTHLIAPNATEGVINGVNLHSVEKAAGSRLVRMTKTVREVYRKAVKVNADIYQFHDPELLPVGVLLKVLGKKVIYDVHENVPQDILTKKYIPTLLRSIIASVIGVIEKISARIIDGVVTATPAIARRFPRKKTVAVENFPIKGELVSLERNPYSSNIPFVVYVGAISEIRGIEEMVKAMSLIPESKKVELVLVGNFSSPELEKNVQHLPGWNRVKFLGWQSRESIKELLSKALGGLVIFHPVPNHTDAQPNKLFEYMSAGVPVIASDFPLWRELVEGSGSGLHVDPLSSSSLANAIIWLLDNPQKAALMSEKGSEAVRQRFNWDEQARKLIDFYHKIT